MPGGERARVETALADLAWAVVPVAIGVVVAGGSVALLGYSPVEALRALLAGALGSGAALTATLLKATPLLLTGLAVALCFRCGVWNIGAEGQLYVGALLATVVGAPPTAATPPALPTYRLQASRG